MELASGSSSEGLSPEDVVDKKAILNSIVFLGIFECFWMSIYIYIYVEDIYMYMIGGCVSRVGIIHLQLQGRGKVKRFQA